MIFDEIRDRSVIAIFFNTGLDNWCKFSGRVFNPNCLRLRKFRKFIFFLGALIVVFALTGCADTRNEKQDDYLIRVGERVLTVDDFNKAFGDVKSAYPHGSMRNPGFIKNSQGRFLNQLVEEMLLLERAQELHIEVSDTEIDTAVSNIKQDYPDDVFDQMLLEYAVSYRFWKEKLKLRMLMEKVIAKELGEKISITSEDVASYYKKHYEGENLGSDLNDESKDINEMIIKHLRREKAEEAYKTWIEKLQTKYVVEINEKLWEKVSG